MAFKEPIGARGNKHTPEPEVLLLRQFEVAVANGKNTSLPCKEASITDSGLLPLAQGVRESEADQARRLKKLKSANAKLKRLVSELSLEKLALKGIASGNL